MVVSNIFYVHPYLGKVSNLTIFFQLGWNHQLQNILQLSMARWNIHHVPSMDPQLIRKYPTAGIARWHGATASSYLGGLRLLRARLRARVIGGPLGMFFLYRFFLEKCQCWFLYPRKKGVGWGGGYFMKMRVMGHIAFWVNKLYG